MGLPLRPAAASEYINVVKGKAHEAMPRNELNQPGERASTSERMLRAAFQPKAGSWNRNTGLILEAGRKAGASRPCEVQSTRNHLKP
jgi:hypothetical protein